MEEEEYGALWDNVLTVAEGAVPVANPATIMAGHIVLFWMEDRDDEKREWWLGKVVDRPAPEKGTSMEVQVYNTHDRDKPLDVARFSLCWRDLKSKRFPPPEEFTSDLKKAKKKGLQAYLVSIDAASVILTGLQMRPGGRIAKEALEMIGGGDKVRETLTKVVAEVRDDGSAGEAPVDYPHMTEEQAELLEEQPQTVEAFQPKAKAPKRRAARRRRKAK